MRLLRFARNDENSRIPKHRDPPVKLGDDTRALDDDGYLRNSRILKLEFLEIASVALLPRNDAGNFRILYRDPRDKPEDDTRLMRSPDQVGG